MDAAKSIVTAHACTIQLACYAGVEIVKSSAS